MRHPGQARNHYEVHLLSLSREIVIMLEEDEEGKRKRERVTLTDGRLTSASVPVQFPARRQSTEQPVLKGVNLLINGRDLFLIFRHILSSTGRAPAMTTK